MKIAFIQAGGTIDKDYLPNHEHHGYNFQINEPAYEDILKNIKPRFQYSTQVASRKDSIDFTDADRQRLFDMCSALPEKTIIITHGTDTIKQTAAVLSQIRGKTIVLTGARQPRRFLDSDASFNVGMAVGAAHSFKEGVYIALNGVVTPWQEYEDKV